MYTMVDVDVKYLDETKKPPFRRRLRAKMKCTKAKLITSLEYIFPIIAVLRNYEIKNFAISKFSYIVVTYAPLIFMDLRALIFFSVYVFESVQRRHEFERKKIF